MRHATERPENLARIELGRFFPVTPFHQLNAGAGGNIEAMAVDVGLLVVSGALRVAIGDEADNAGDHQLYFPAQFCLVAAGTKHRWESLAENTSFYQVWIRGEASA